jgi:hypothetical protein
MYQAKVNNTETYSDSQGEHLVCKGVLRSTYKGEGVERENIIISKTEEVLKGDQYRGFFKYNKQGFGIIYPYKILALPKHFSDKHLQAIVDGKLKDGDEVYVKCIRVESKPKSFSDLWKIYLNQQNHITLFPVKQSLEEAAYEYARGQDAVDEYAIGFMAGAEWAKKNNY